MTSPMPQGGPNHTSVMKQTHKEIAPWSGGKRLVTIWRSTSRISWALDTASQSAMPFMAVAAPLALVVVCATQLGEGYSRPVTLLALAGIFIGLQLCAWAFRLGLQWFRRLEQQRCRAAAREQGSASERMIEDLDPVRGAGGGAAEARPLIEMRAAGREPGTPTAWPEVQGTGTAWPEVQGTGFGAPVDFCS